MIQLYTQPFALQQLLMAFLEKNIHAFIHIWTTSKYKTKQCCLFKAIKEKYPDFIAI